MESTTLRTERRTDQRELREDKIRLEWSDASSNVKSVLGRCVDISPKGMRVEIQERLPQNQYVRFELLRQNFRGTATVRNLSVAQRRVQLGLEFAWSARWKGAAS